MPFRDRSDAGAQLGERLLGERLRDVVVLALPRGGVPVAFEVAAMLNAPLEVFVARKLGAPGQPELGIGAIAEDGTKVLTADLVRVLGLTDAQLGALVEREQRELERRVSQYRGEREVPDLRDRDVVVVDDGLATGVTAEAALRSLRARAPRRLLLAVPVCAPDTAERLAELADIVCLMSPRDFRAVGLWYDDFGQTADETVVALLERSATDRPVGRRE